MSPFFKLRLTETGRSDGSAGAIISTVAACFVTVNDVILKELLLGLPLMQVLFLRSTLAVTMLLVCVPFVGGRQKVVPKSWNGTLWLAGLQVPTLFLFPYSLSFMPLTTALVLVYAAPLFVVFISRFVLKRDQIGPRRMMAVAIGFAGAAIVVNPTFAGFDAVMLIPLFCALMLAVRDVMTSQVALGSHPLTITMTSMVLLMIGSGGFVAFEDWQPIAQRDVVMVLGSTTLMVVGQLLWIVAFTTAPAYLVTTIKYSAVIWSLVLSYLVWSEIPTFREVVGGLLVILSSIAIVLIRERVSLTSGKR